MSIVIEVASMTTSSHLSDARSTSGVDVILTMLQTTHLLNRKIFAFIDQIFGSAKKE